MTLQTAKKKIIKADAAQAGLLRMQLPFQYHRLKTMQAAYLKLSMPDQDLLDTWYYKKFGVYMTQNKKD